MARSKTALRHATPYAVEQALKLLGANLRTARLRRNMTIHEVAARIGSGPRAVSDAERGQPGTAAAVYIALLWVYNLLSQMEPVADPASDQEGLVGERQRQRGRASKGRLSNDF